MASIIFRNIVSVVLLFIVLVSVDSNVVRRNAVQGTDAKVLARAQRSQLDTTLPTVQASIAGLLAVMGTLETQVNSLTTTVTAQLNLNRVTSISGTLTAEVNTVVKLTGSTASSATKSLSAQLVVVQGGLTTLTGLAASVNVLQGLSAQLNSQIAVITTLQKSLPGTQAGLTGAILVQVNGALNAAVVLVGQIEVAVNNLNVQIGGAVVTVNGDLAVLLGTITTIEQKVGATATAKVDGAIFQVSGTVSTAFATIASVDGTINASVGVVFGTLSGVVVAANTVVNTALNLALTTCLCVASVGK